MAGQLVSIIIPTMNRSDFLIRALNYYRSVGFKGYICIGDSSYGEHSRIITDFIKEIGSDLNIIYKYYSNPPYYNDAICVKDLLELVVTPYAVESGDDDFLVPSALEKCASFLQENPDYGSAHGLRVALRLEGDSVYGKAVQAHNCHQLALSSPRACDRWSAYMRHPVSNLYSVHRIGALRNIYKHPASLNMRYIGTEITTVGLSVICGKVKEIDCLSTVFQVNRNNSLANYSFYSYLMDPGWSEGAGNLKRIITAALKDADGISQQKAQEIFDREFWRFILNSLHWDYKTRYKDLPYENPFIKAAKKCLSKIPGFIRMANYLIGKVLSHKNKNNLGSVKSLSLGELLNARSEISRDFLKVYSIIQGKFRPGVK
ncbi:MAG: TIGR00180 family glycosyltransferase [Candidatus Omnitrophota bacterium]